MKYLIVALCFLGFGAIDMAHGADEKFLSCGPGYVLASRSKLDGVTAYECQKLWCRDLELGKAMGSGNSAASGYKSTNTPIELCDALNNCIECFGDRSWCSGEISGVWNPEYGAYTRGGNDSSMYVSYQKGGCFAWRLEKPSCPNGQTAILQNDEWVCATSTSGDSGINRESSIRRTGTIRRIIR